MKKLVTLFLGLVLISCGNSVPSENEAKTNVSEIILEATNNNVELTQLTKTDGLKEVENEIALYTMEFEGEVKFLKDTYSKLSMPFSGSRREAGFLEISDKKPVTYEPHSWKEVESPGYDLIKSNTFYKIKGKVEYIKKEKGWKINDLYMKINN